MSESECPECGSILRYWPSEVKTEILPGRATYPFRAPELLYDYITCPLCGKRLILHRYGKKSENVCPAGHGDGTAAENLEWCTKEENAEAFLKNHGFRDNAYRNPHRKREGASKR